MTPTLHIIANCTERKTVPPISKMRLRSIPRVPVRERVDLWRESVRTWGSEKVRAQDLYSGEHWSTVMKLPDAAREAGFQPRLWVASAGHGLISGDAMIASYSATFSSGHPDSTYSEEGHLGSWWNRLAAARSASVRKVSDLAGESARSHVLVVCSAAYVADLESDISEAAEIAEGRLALVSSAYKRPSPLSANLDAVILKAEAPLRQKFGGSLTGLNARLALAVLGAVGGGGWDLERLRKSVKNWIADCPDLPRIRGSECSDADVERFIKTNLKSAPLTWTRLLRSFRDGGKACEQNRFRKLYRRIERAL